MLVQRGQHGDPWGRHAQAGSTEPALVLGRRWHARSLSRSLDSIKFVLFRPWRGEYKRAVRSVPSEVEPGYPTEHERILRDAGEIARFHDRCSDLMRELLTALARFPEEPRPFPEVEDEMGWPRRRIASVLGGVAHMRHAEFAGARPYHFLAPRQAATRRWEIWMDAAQARAIRAAQRNDRGATPAPR
jgi:hypothetical protein